MNSILTLVFLVITLSMHVFSEGQPVLMWSNTNTFAHQNNRKVEISSAKGLNDLIWDPMSKYFDNTNLKPEVVLIFAENILTSQESPLEQGFEFKSDGGSFPNLKAVIADSQSSIVLPFIKNGQSLSIEAIAQLANSLSGNTYIVEDPDTTKQTLIAEKGVILSKLQSLTDSNKLSAMNSEQLLNNLRSKVWKPLTNGKIDLVVVGFQNQPNSAEKLASDDSKIKSIINAFETIQYSAFFVTDIEYRKSHETRSDESIAENHFRSIESSHIRIRGELDYWTDDVLEALIIMVPFIGIVLIGIVCTCKLQSDLKFDHEKNILKKH